MTPKWDRRFLALAEHIAGWSKDPSTQVGCVIVNEDRIVVGMGYNGFPRGVQDLEHRLNDREQKYKLVVHAEANAILNTNSSTMGCTVYVTLAPCCECMKLLIQAGIKRVVHPLPTDEQFNRWGESFVHSTAMAKEAGVELVPISGTEKE